MEKDFAYKLYQLGNTMSLNKKDINLILNENNKLQEQTYFSAGPNWYPGGRYGTISIKEF